MMDDGAVAQVRAMGIDYIIMSDEACLETAEEAEDDAQWITENKDHSLALAFAKLERNAVVGLQPFQLHAAKHESAIRNLIFNITTSTRIADSRFFTLIKVLTQLLSNIISPSSRNAGADALANKYLHLYVSGNRKFDIIVRILDSEEPGTHAAVLHLLRNVTRDTRTPRLRLLFQPTGIRWCAKILARMGDWLNTTNHDLYELGSSIFNLFISQNLQSSLFSDLREHGQVVTPYQTVLLRLIDTSLASDMPTKPHGFKNPNQFTIHVFLNIKAKDKMVAGGKAQVNASEESMVAAMKHWERGIIEILVDLLRAFGGFFPRTKRYLLPPTASPPSSPQPSGAVPDELNPFADLRGDLVRLLGILASEDTDVGGQVREHGGVHLVSSWADCEERDRYLYKQALFCIRNLTNHNPANRAVVDEMYSARELSDLEEEELLPSRKR
ncbi:hypothetical protein IAT38_004021 [Cryptococcus sp. DSM 104549]